MMLVNNCETPIDLVYNDVSTSHDQNLCRRRDHQEEFKKGYKRESFKHRLTNHLDWNMPANVCQEPECRLTYKRPLSPILDEGLFMVKDSNTFNIPERKMNRKIFSRKNISKKKHAMRRANNSMINRQVNSTTKSHKAIPWSSHFIQYGSFKRENLALHESNHKKIGKTKSYKHEKEHYVPRSKHRAKAREKILDEIVDDFVRNRSRVALSSPRKTIFTPFEAKREEASCYCQVSNEPRQRVTNFTHDENYEPDDYTFTNDTSGRRAAAVLNEKFFKAKSLRANYERVFKSHAKPAQLKSKGTYSVVNKKTSPPKRMWMPHRKVTGVEYVSLYSMPPPQGSKNNMRKRRPLQKKISSLVDRKSTPINLKNSRRRFSNLQHHNTCSYGTHHRRRYPFSKVRQTSSSKTGKLTQSSKKGPTTKKYEFNPTTKHLSDFNKKTHSQIRHDNADEELDFALQRESMKSADINRKINDNYFNTSQKSYMEYHEMQKKKFNEYKKIKASLEQFTKHREKDAKPQKRFDIKKPKFDSFDNDRNEVAGINKIEIKETRHSLANNTTMSDFPLTVKSVSDFKSTEINNCEISNGKSQAVKNFSEEIDHPQSENVNNSTDSHSKCFRIENSNQTGFKPKNCIENIEMSKFSPNSENKLERFMHQSNKLVKTFTTRRTLKSPKTPRSPKKLITSSNIVPKMSFAPIWKGCAIDSRQFGPVAINLDELRNQMERFASRALYVQHEREIPKIQRIKDKKHVAY